MARTVISVIQAQSKSTTNYKSPLRPASALKSSKNASSSAVSSSASTKVSVRARSLPPKKIARVAKKLPKKEQIDFESFQSNRGERKLSVADGNSSDIEFRSNKVKKSTKETGGIKSKYLTMIMESIYKLQSKNGSSRTVILNQLKLDYSDVIGSNEANINLNLKLALKMGLDTEVLKMARESGKGSGSFKLTKEAIKTVKQKITSNLSPGVKQDVGAKVKHSTPRRKNSTSNVFENMTVTTPDSYVRMENLNQTQTSIIKGIKPVTPVSEKVKTKPNTDLRNSATNRFKPYVNLEKVSEEEIFASCASPRLRKLHPGQTSTPR